MSKNEKAFAITYLIIMIIFLPLFSINQYIVGIAANDQGYLAVAADSVHNGETTYLYIYSDNSELQKTVRLYGFRGGISAIREENDLIGIYYHTTGTTYHKYIYDYTGALVSEEYIEEEKIKSTITSKKGSTEYAYIQNKLGYEKVKKYTADGKSKTVYRGTSSYINKILLGFGVTSFLAFGLCRGLIFPLLKPDRTFEDFLKKNIGTEELREVEAKIRDTFKAKGNIFGKIKFSAYILMGATVLMLFLNPLASAFTYICHSFFP